jgi:hypothetical protein
VSNFRFARQPPTIVTWAELHFHNLPLIRPSGRKHAYGVTGIFRYYEIFRQFEIFETCINRSQACVSRIDMVTDSAAHCPARVRRVSRSERTCWQKNDGQPITPHYELKQ